MYFKRSAFKRHLLAHTQAPTQNTHMLHNLYTGHHIPMVWIVP